MSGTARWLAPGKALVQFSLRHKTDDHFWFSLFHELSHLLDTPRTDHVHDDTGDVPADEDAERQADQRGRDLLIDPDRYRDFVRAGRFGAAEVRELARELGISPASWWAICNATARCR